MLKEESMKRGHARKGDVAGCVKGGEGTTGVWVVTEAGRGDGVSAAIGTGRRGMEGQLQ